MVGPATAKHQAPTHRLKLYVGDVIKSRRAIEEEATLKPVVGFTTRHADCRMIS